MTVPIPTPVEARPRATHFLIAARQSEIRALEAFLVTGRLVASISNLVHALQRERGTSNLYLGSAGLRYGLLREQAIVETQQWQPRLEADLAVLGGDDRLAGASRLFSRIAFAVHALEGLPALREQVRAMAFTPESTTRLYSDIIQRLLAVVFEAAEIAAEPAIARTLVAMFNFMQGKELAGQERAVGSAGFAGEHFGTVHSERLLHLVESQDRCFQLFQEFADEPALTLYRQLTSLPEYGEFERMRRIACTASLRQGAIPMEQDISDHWFRIATARVDAMKQVEDQLEEQLLRQCEQALRDAKESLAHQQSLIDTLEHPSQANDYFVVLYPQSSGPQEQQRIQAEGMPPRLGRSLIGMLHDQSQRLQNAEQALSATRDALEERKLLEQAKALLMKHRKLSEDDAHRLLRRMAMNQGKRLVDIARTVTTLTDFWE